MRVVIMAMVQLKSVEGEVSSERQALARAKAETEEAKRRMEQVRRSSHCESMTSPSAYVWVGLHDASRTASPTRVDACRRCMTSGRRRAVWLPSSRRASRTSTTCRYDPLTTPTPVLTWVFKE